MKYSIKITKYATGIEKCRKNSQKAIIFRIPTTSYHVFNMYSL